MGTRIDRSAWFGAVLTLATCLGPAAAAEFRILTRVYMGNEKTPASENLTLFKNGVVYDYIAAPQEVTMFDPRGGRFVLIDVDRKLRTQIPTKEVANHIQELRAKMATQNENPIFQFFQNPQFETSVDPQSDELLLESPYLTYRITTKPAPQEAALRTYIQFANWYAQLNSVTKPGSTPPFPRMAVNDALEARGVIPSRIIFTATNPSKLAASKSITLRSEHEVQWKLFADDQRQIDETGRHLVAFKLVSPTEYLQVAPGQGAAQQVQRPGARAR